jgi:phenylpyruvate tautomerase PptA (4-oxalocrotonate tautomerase family)
MPFWQVFAPENAYTDEDKEALATSITSMYTDFVNLPKFYVVVNFHEQPANSMYVGGKPANNFVRILVDHIARRIVGQPELQALCMQIIESKIAPWVSERGYDWEVHVDETPAELWRTQGLTPPDAGSDGERLWAEKNRAVPYEVATAS